jgi:hypothetical protein
MGDYHSATLAQLLSLTPARHLFLIGLPRLPAFSSRREKHKFPLPLEVLNSPKPCDPGTVIAAAMTPPIGPEVLAPEVDAETSLDIVFVHGLHGHRTDSWSNNGLCWSRDLLRDDIKNARVISWGFDADVTNFLAPSSQDGVFGHARNLLGDIAMERGHTASCSYFFRPPCVSGGLSATHVCYISVMLIMLCAACCVFFRANIHGKAESTPYYLGRT